MTRHGWGRPSSPLLPQPRRLCPCTRSTQDAGRSLCRQSHHNRDASVPPRDRSLACGAGKRRCCGAPCANDGGHVDVGAQPIAVAACCGAAVVQRQAGATGKLRRNGSAAPRLADGVDGLLKLSYKDILLRQSCLGTEEVAAAPMAKSSQTGTMLQLQPNSKNQQQDGRRRAAFLAKMRGLCFNCLAKDHKVAQCCNPTRCWMCRQSGHISSICPKRKHCPSPLSNSTSCGQVRTEFSQQQASRRYAFLSKMRGLCFNCLAQDHMVAQCRSLARCWVCYKLGHISSGCPSRLRRQLRPTTPGVTGGRSDPLGCHSSPPAMMESPKDVDGSTATNKEEVPPLLNMLPCSDVSFPNQHAEDPTILESELVTEERPKLVELEASGKCYDQASEEISGDSQTPLMIRNEAEQLIGHQLIKVLSDFKHDAVAPLSSSTPLTSSEQLMGNQLIKALGNLKHDEVNLVLQNISSEKEAIVVSSKDNQRCNQKSKLKVECQKSAFKMVRDMLTKKWIFVREPRHLGDWTLQRFLHACKKPTNVSRTEAIRNQVERFMLMKAFRKLARASEKKKNKGINNK